MKKFITILILFTSFALTAYAGDVSRKGTTGADELLIPVGARGIATGGAFLASLTGLESIYYNPAGLDLTHGTEAMFSYMTYIADINVSYFAISTSFGDFGSFALSFKSLDFGNIPVTTVDHPDGTGQTYSPGFLTSTLSYSKVITDRISVGTNLKIISESIENTSAVGVGLDMGVQYRFNDRLSMGATIKNVGTNMQYTGSDLQTTTNIPGALQGSSGGSYQVVTEPFQLPSYFEMSLAYNYNFNEQNNMMLGATYSVNNSYEDVAHFGLEYGFMNMFFLRAGYNLLAQNTSQSIYGFTAGAGVQYQTSNKIGLSFDYAYRSVKDFPTANHIFTVKISIL